MTIFPTLIAIWWLGTVFPPALDSEVSTIWQLVALAWLPALMVLQGRYLFFMGPAFRQRGAMLFGTVATLAGIIASAATSEDPLHSLEYTAAAGIGLFCCAGTWQLVRSQISDSLAAYSVCGSILSAALYFFGPRIDGRLSISEASHANYLGLVAFGFLMSALAVQNRLLRIVLIAVNFIAIVAAQSRGPLVAAFIGILLYYCLPVLRVRSIGKALSITSLILLTIGALIILQTQIEETVSSLLFLNDKYRGLGTGFTRRLDAWQEATDLFVANPVLGVGFRMHEQYMTTLSSAHNGYLSLLADVGIVGAVSPFLLTIFAAWRLLKRAISQDPLARLGISFVAGYLFLATFERFFLGMGNPTSIIAWTFLFIPEMSAQAAPKSASQQWQPRITPQLT